MSKEIKKDVEVTTENKTDDISSIKDEIIMNAKSSKIDIDSLVDQVNILDELIEEEYDDEEPNKDLMLNNFKIYLMDILLKLNNIKHINPMDCVYNDELITIYNDGIRHMSKIFNDKKMYPITSKQFKIRFMSYVISDVILRIDKIVDRTYTIIDCSDEIDSYDVLIEVINSILSKSIELLQNKESDISDLWSLLTLCKGKTNKKKKVTDIFMSALDAVSNGVAINDEDETVKLNDTYLADYIAKLSYILITESSKGEIEPPTDNFNFNNKHHNYDLIKNLGTSLLNYKESGCKIGNMYTSFAKSRPELWFSKKFDLNDPAINTGCRALAFLSFVTNDKNVKKYVKKICGF